ncbi:MAG: hypothetical protein EAZ54_13895 [Curvibacter sp.]|nr:MAG: hypothetical protein EAZ54_13895 [Curvibacter sp.]
MKLGRLDALLRVPRPLCGLLLDLRKTSNRPNSWDLTRVHPTGVEQSALPHKRSAKRQST